MSGTTDFVGVRRFSNLRSTVAKIDTRDSTAIGLCLPAPTAYARVDLVEFERKPALMEIELIEPELFLGASALAADRFADVLQRRCAARTEAGC